MKRVRGKATRVQEACVSLLLVLLLGGNLTLAIRTSAQDPTNPKTIAPAGAVAAHKAGQEGKSSQSDPLPVITVEKGRYGTYVTVRSASMSDLILDMWCYELGQGEPISHEREGNTMVLVHQSGEAKVTTRFEPCPDGVDIRVPVMGPNAEAVRWVRSLNPCCMFDRSTAFRGTGDYVDDFVARCFVFLDSGLTLLKDTKRLPGTLPKDDARAKGPKPWIQEYYPARRKHRVKKRGCARPAQTGRSIRSSE